MDPIFAEILKQSPSAAAVVLVAYLFIQAETKRQERRIEADRVDEARRVENAKALESERQKHEREINNMWANYLKKLTENVSDSFKALMTEMEGNEERALDRYNRLNYTGRNIEKAVTDPKAKE